jgi:hypothetical protein
MQALYQILNLIGLYSVVLSEVTNRIDSVEHYALLFSALSMVLMIIMVLFIVYFDILTCGWLQENAFEPLGRFLERAVKKARHIKEDPSASQHELNTNLGSEPSVLWSVDPVVRRMLDCMNDPAVRDALDRLVVELRAKHGAVDKMLQQMDSNKDGILDRDELCHALTEMGVQLSRTELDSVMRAFDKDRTGNIEYAEFYTVLTKHHVQGYAIEAMPTSTRAVPRSQSGVLLRELPEDLQPDDAAVRWEYLIQVTTGKPRGSGTDSKVFAQLFGEWLPAGSGEIELSDDVFDGPMDNKFEAGGVDCFKVRCPPLGNVVAIRLWHDNSGVGPGWFCESVSVLRKSRSWAFPVCKWFDRQKGDGKIDRIFVLGTADGDSMLQDRDGEAEENVDMAEIYKYSPPGAPASGMCGGSQGWNGRLAAIASARAAPRSQHSSAHSYSSPPPGAPTSGLQDGWKGRLAAIRAVPSNMPSPSGAPPSNMHGGSHGRLAEVGGALGETSDLDSSCGVSDIEIVLHRRAFALKSDERALEALRILQPD